MSGKNRIIAFANQKGGVGKSTLCIMLANYLCEKGEAVAVIDADLQQTIFDQRNRELQTAETDVVPWDVAWLDTRNRLIVENGIKAAKTFPGTILIDAPGNMSDDNLVPIYANVDYIIIPITYHPNVVDSSAKFANAIISLNKALGAHSKILFVPNLIDDRRTKNIEELKGYVREKLSPFGNILTRINNRAWFERISTINYTAQQIGSVTYAFDRVLNEIKRLEK